MEYNFENTMASMLQFWNWLEDKRGEDNKVSRGVWKIIKAKARKTRIAETKERKEARRERVEEELKEKKQNKRTIEVKEITEKWKIFGIRRRK